MYIYTYTIDFDGQILHLGFLCLCAQTKCTYTFLVLSLSGFKIRTFIILFFKFYGPDQFKIGIIYLFIVSLVQNMVLNLQSSNS